MGEEALCGPYRARCRRPRVRRRRRVQEDGPRGTLKGQRYLRGACRWGGWWCSSPRNGPISVIFLLGVYTHAHTNRKRTSSGFSPIFLCRKVSQTRPARRKRQKPALRPFSRLSPHEIPSLVHSRSHTFPQPWLCDSNAIGITRPSTPVALHATRKTMREKRGNGRRQPTTPRVTRTAVKTMRTVRIGCTMTAKPKASDELEGDSQFTYEASLWGNNLTSQTWQP